VKEVEFEKDNVNPKSWVKVSHEDFLSMKQGLIDLQYFIG